MRTNADPRMVTERMLRGSELALEAARRDTADAMLACEELSERILALEAELADARREPGRLQLVLAAEARARRVAEQQAYAERVRREELQQELAIQRELEQSEAAAEERGEVHERQRELEAEAEALRREVDELGHLVGSARQARDRAEHRVAELTGALERAEQAAARTPSSGPSRDPDIAAGLALEFALAGQPVPPSPLVTPDPVGNGGANAQLALERRLVQARATGASVPAPVASADPVAEADPPAAADPEPALAQLRAEVATLAAQAQHETAARLSVEARAVELERELTEQISRSSRAYEAIEELRKRLGAIGGLSVAPPRPKPESEPVAAEPKSEEPKSEEPVAAEPKSEEPVAAEPTSAEPATPRPAPSSAAAVVVEPERFSAALTRLREAMPAEAMRAEAMPPATRTPEAGLEPGPAPEPAELSPDTPPGPPVAWLPGVFRLLARDDPAAAGQLVLELLPAQRAVHPDPIAYDIELPGQTCIQLTIDDGGLKLELGARRPPSEVRFAVTGDSAGLARLLAAGRIGRRLRRGLARVTGDRHGLQAMEALVRAPFSLRQLHDAGVRLDPPLALEVVARMIDPGWTSGPRFAIGYRPRGGAPVLYLEVGEGRAARVSDAVAPELVAGTIAGEAESLLTLLDGGDPAAPEFDGERAQLSRVMSWVKRAQSG